MSLRDIATEDLNIFLSEDFAWPITITDPDGTILNTTGYTNDIAQTIDPDTGQIVSGRVASIAISIRELEKAGLSIPINIVDETTKPWRIAFEDVELNQYTFKVISSNPDLGLGLVTCNLELYGN